MMSVEASMADYYADRAQEYERVYQKAERQADLNELRGIVQTEFSGAHVFEVACGTGYWTELLARSAASVVATDINESVVALARSKRIDRRQVTFRREDAYTLPVLPQKFTGGWMCERGSWNRRPPQHLSTIEEFREWREAAIMGCGTVEISGGSYTVLLAPAGRYLASGPSAYLFDEAGRYVDWTADMGHWYTVRNRFDLTGGVKNYKRERF